MIPIHLTLENFLSHTFSELHFNFSSALIIGEFEGDHYMSNGAGKSSIFEGISWALFGKSRCKYANSIVKDGRTTCKVTLLFEHDGVKYKVIRTRNAKYASQNSLEFFEILDDGTEEQIKADTNTELDKKIREVIHSSYEVFINSSYFQQGDISGFLNGNASERQKIVSSILNLDRWNKYKDIADKRYKTIDKELSLMKYKLTELEDIEEKISTLETDLENDRAKSKQLSLEEERLSESIKALELKISNIKMQNKNLSDYHETKNKYDYAVSKIAELSATQEEKLKLIQVSQDEIQKNTAAIHSTEAKIVELAPTLQLKEKLNVSDFEHKLVKGRVKLDVLSSQIHNIESNEECDACGTTWADKSKKEALIFDKKKELSELSAKIKRAETKLNAKKEKEREIKQTELDIEKYVARTRTLTNNNEMHELRISSMESELDLIKKSLKEYEQQEKSLGEILRDAQDVFENSDFDDIVEELNKKKATRKRTAADKEELTYSIGANNHKLERLQEDKEKKKKLMVAMQKLNREASVYSNLVRSFGRNGIQAIIVDNVMEELSKVTNDQLNDFTATPTYVNFITQKQDSKGSWKETLEIDIRTPSGVREFDSLSGGESFRVAFAIRLALSAIQARRMGGQTQLLMLDEVSTSLDPHGLEAFVSIIRRLEKDLKVMVITHDDKFKEEFDHIIVVKKTGDDSEILQD